MSLVYHQRKNGLTVISTLGNVVGYSGAPGTMRAVRGMKDHVHHLGRVSTNWWLSLDFTHDGGIYALQ